MENSQIPPYLNETYLHAEVCNRYVDIKYKHLDEDIRKILVNLYRKESGQLLEITQKKFYNQETIPLEELNVKISSVKFKIKTLIKVFINRVFLFFRKKDSVHSSTIVRSWVEDCLELFNDDIDQHCIFFVYPFAIKINRQLLFLKELKRRSLDYTLIGLDYSWIDCFKWLYTSNDVDYVYMEYNANIKHSDLILNKYSAKKILTTDEFEIASFVIHGKLKSSINIINSAHGMGKYSPYVDYDIFYIFNGAQEEYYKLLSPNIEYKYISIPKNEDYEFNGNVILISQALDYDDDSFISREEKKIIEAVKDIEGFRFYIKLHPNSKMKEFVCQKSGRNLIIDDGADLKNSIFLTLYSTAYYTFQIYGMTYLVETEYNKPDLLFGASERIILVSELNKLLENI